MNISKLAMLSLFSISATSAFAEGGGDRVIQRSLERQQAYLAAQRAEEESKQKNAEVVTSEPNVKPPVSADC